VYTDGSFVHELTCSAFIYDGQVFSYRLHNFNSVFTAELYAFYQALLFIRCQSQQCHFIFTVSLSALQGLNCYSPDHPIIIEILIQLSSLHKSGKSIVFCWVPDHTGLPGNKAADAAAEVATLHRTLVSDRTLGSDVHTFLHCTILSSWQDECNNAQGNKLHVVKSSVQVWQSSFSVVR
jgi:hypothetical protein